MWVLPSLVSTALRPGESFESWLARFAFLRRSHTSDLLAQLGLPKLRDGVGPQWFWSLGGDVLELISGLSRVPAIELRSAEFSALAGDLFPTAGRVRDVTGTGWVSVGTLRFCPQCLAEGSGFLWRWRLGCVVACVEHGLLLRLGCGECGRVRSSALAHPPIFLVKIQEIEFCPHCSRRLTDRRWRQTATADVIDAQTAVHKALDGDARLFGEPVTADVWLSAVTSTAGLSMLAATAGKRRRLDRDTAPDVSRNRKRDLKALLSADPAIVAPFFAEAVDAVEFRTAFRSLRTASLERVLYTSRRSTADALLTPELAAVGDLNGSGTENSKKAND